jgi:hypothetical protein
LAGPEAQAKTFLLTKTTGMVTSFYEQPFH